MGQRIGSMVFHKEWKSTPSASYHFARAIACHQPPSRTIGTNPCQRVVGTANPYINRREWTANRHTDNVQDQPVQYTFQQMHLRHLRDEFPGHSVDEVSAALQGADWNLANARAVLESSICTITMHEPLPLGDYNQGGVASTLAEWEGASKSTTDTD